MCFYLMNFKIVGEVDGDEICKSQDHTMDGPSNERKNENHKRND